MDVKEALLKRRSVRKFTDEPIPEEMIQELLHAAMSGPSACNKRPWEFYVITEAEMLKKLKGATPFSKMDAKLAIVVCGNLTRGLPNYLGEYWIQDCSAATQNMLLRGVELGLGSVWCGVHPQKLPTKKVKELLDLTEKQIPLNIVYFGFPKEEVEPRDWFDEKYVHYLK